MSVPYSTDQSVAKSRPIKVKIRAKRIDGVATLIQFAECQGIIFAANMRDLKKLARGFYLVDFDPKKARRVSIKSRK